MRTLNNSTTAAGSGTVAGGRPVGSIGLPVSIAEMVAVSAVKILVVLPSVTVKVWADRVAANIAVWKTTAVENSEEAAGLVKRSKLEGKFTSSVPSRVSVAFSNATKSTTGAPSPVGTGPAGLVFGIRATVSGPGPCAGSVTFSEAGKVLFGKPPARSRNGRFSSVAESPSRRRFSYLQRRIFDKQPSLRLGSLRAFSGLRRRAFEQDRNCLRHAESVTFRPATSGIGAARILVSGKRGRYRFSVCPRLLR